MTHEVTIHSGPYEGGNYEHHWTGAYLEAHLISDVGKRRRANEDVCAAAIPSPGSQGRETLFVVADGMGGARGGAYASRLAVETICECFYNASNSNPNGGAPERLRGALVEANSRILSAGEGNPGLKGMGTTASAAAVLGDQAYIAQVGDSRVYAAWNNGGLQQVTEDHSYVADQVRQGMMNEEEARTHAMRNLITRALGARQRLEVDLYAVQLAKGDALLLCSDGLSSVVEDGDIEVALAQEASPERAARSLVRQALEKGAPDNVTAVVLKVTAAPPEASRQVKSAVEVLPERKTLFGRLRRILSP
ncbi:MAG: Stp1/IreP family PP2C-type Ser/Thr phosphatase [Candidatus Hydrogenedentota bacterium]